MRMIFTSVAVLLAASACAIADQHAEEEEPLPEGVESCLHLNSVDSIEILDEQHVLFYMRGGQIYNNHLARKCPGLRRNDTIMYRTTLNQLCSIDTFTVLERLGGGFMPGATCALGKFYPTTRDEVEALKARQRD